MRFLFSSILFLIFSTLVFGQKSLDESLERLNSETVPYLYVDEVKSIEHAMILDAREREEFDVSHLKNAIWIGYETFEEDSVIKKIPSKDTAIVVYCSIGVRSEEIGEKLQKAGYTNVKNLYGGIFEWKNQGNKIYNSKAVATDSVHAYNKKWGVLLKKGVKVY